MSKLAKSRETPTKLTNRLSSPFSLCFKYPLEQGYTFNDMSLAQVREFQKFLDLSAQMSFEQAERRYRRQSDTNDIKDGDQVIHYGIGKTFRIHGVIQNAQFVVIRLDPNHKFHS